MTTSTVPQDFASAGNYAAGTDAWSGQPRKVLMTASEKAAGFTPNTPISAELRNGLHAEHFAAGAVAAHGAVQEWSHVVLPVTAGGRSCVFKYLLPVTMPGIQQKAIVACGHDANNANQLVYQRSLGSGLFEDSVNALGSQIGPGHAAPGASGAMLFTNGSTGYALSSLGGSSATNGSHGGALLHYAAFSATPYLAFNSAGGFTKNAAFGSTTAATGPTVTAITANALGIPAGRFVDDGVGVVVLLTKCTVGGTSRYRAIYSSDGGSTWTVSLTLGSGITSADICYSAYSGVFFILTSAGEMYTSANGSAWTLQRTSATITEAGGCATRYNTLAACGSVIAKAFKPSYYSSAFFGTGIVYSFDLGATWRLTQFADADGFGPAFGLTSLIGANGRLWGIDNTRVYRSGLLSFEGADY